MLATDLRTSGIAFRSTSTSTSTSIRVVSLVGAVAVTLFFNKAIPFVTLPSTGITLNNVGFVESLANGQILEFRSDNFGIPSGNFRSFGLAGAWLASLLTRFGIHGADAYTTVYAFFLGVAFLFAFLLARHLGGSFWVSHLGATTWTTLPVVWGHAGYSWLAVGIALLPFYMYWPIRLLARHQLAFRLKSLLYAGFFVATFIAVFIDGYTYVMFALYSGFAMLALLLVHWQTLKREAFERLAVTVLGFMVSTLAYLAYVAESHFQPSSKSVFAAYGLDPVYVAVPTRGVHWAPDFLGWGVERSGADLYGDGSVWGNTFFLPLLVLAVVLTCVTRRKSLITLVSSIVFLVSIWLSLGPALKFNTTLPDGASSALSVAAVPFERVPTGNWWISENLPGFDTMRATYRWSALSIFAIWTITVYAASQPGLGRRIGVGGLVTVMLLNAPPLEKTLTKGVTARSMVSQIDVELIQSLEKDVGGSDLVGFVPWGNDFLLSYAGGRADIRLINVGGDKAISANSLDWPQTFLSLSRRSLQQSYEFDQGSAALGEGETTRLSEGIRTLLYQGNLDVVVIPYFESLWAAHVWPCSHVNDCPEARRSLFESVIDELRLDPQLLVADDALYATVRLPAQNSYPFLASDRESGLGKLLRVGWYESEISHVWSKGEAEIILPIPDGCQDGECLVALKFWAFGGKPDEPLEVRFIYPDGDGGFATRSSAIEDSQIREILIPIGGLSSMKVAVEVPDAISPFSAGVSLDPRELGIALQEIRLLQESR